MALIRWEPAREYAALQHEMDRLFRTASGSVGGAGTTAGAQWLPAMDLVETGDEYVLRADLPGLSDDDVSIQFEDRVLTISGERKSEHEETGEGYYRMERASGAFSRSLTLPEGVEPEAIQARFDRGVLEVRVPKPAQPQPHRVQISVGNQQKTIESQANEVEQTASDGQREHANA